MARKRSPSSPIPSPDPLSRALQHLRIGPFSSCPRATFLIYAYQLYSLLLKTYIWAPQLSPSSKGPAGMGKALRRWGSSSWQSAASPWSDSSLLSVHPLPPLPTIAWGRVLLQGLTPPHPSSPRVESSGEGGELGWCICSPFAHLRSWIHT